MCGICGIINLGIKSEISKEEILSMREAMLHRGPDSSGLFMRDNFAMGVRRLKVIDLVSGDQPILNEDMTVAVMLNGEIYNYKELKKELLNNGHKFYTNSDTEVLAHLYEEKGEEFVKYLNGIFGISLWDDKKKILLIARDGMGVKPLYYYNDGKRFAFASEVKSILMAKGIAYEIDRSALDSYLSVGYVPGEETIFSSIKRLPAGSIGIMSGKDFKIIRYWDVEPSPESMLKEEDAAIELLDKIKLAVSRQLAADVPVGILLSGGVDSGLITALASTLCKDKVRTYNVSFEDNDSYNESKFAERISQIFGTDHSRLVMNPRDCKFLPKLIRYLDEPLADQAVVPAFLISRFARGQVTVALSGEGGDELFAGYGHYERSHVEKNVGLLKRIPDLGVECLSAVFNKMPQDFKGNLLFTRYAPYRNSSFAERYFYSSQVIFNPSERKALCTDEVSGFFKSGKENSRLREYFKKIGSYDELNQMLYLDTKCYLPDDLLMKVDKMSMAVSLEARVPFLDKDLVEFAVKLPSAYKLKNGIFKYILKKAARKVLPSDILDRQKHGFEVPVREWLRTGLRDFIGDHLSEDEIKRDGLFNYSEIKRMLETHNSGRYDYNKQIWALLVFQAWKTTFINKKP